jgi:hypothetical protein
MASTWNHVWIFMVRPLLFPRPTKGDAMKRFVLTLAWVLWAHELAVVGDKVVDRGSTAIDSFETRQACQAAMADYAGLKLVRQGKVKLEFTCAPEAPAPKGPKTATG